jgi:hypothetical protein
VLGTGGCGGVESAAGGLQHRASAWNDVQQPGIGLRLWGELDALCHHLQRQPRAGPRLSLRRNSAGKTMRPALSILMVWDMARTMGGCMPF